MLALFTLALLVGCGTSPTLASPQPGKDALAGVIVDGNGKAVSQDELLAAVGAAHFAFVGEKHDNTDHHGIEALLIETRLAQQPGSAIVFEMLDDAQRPALPTLDPDDDVETIRAKLTWPEKGWDLEVYGPLFQETLHGGTLVAGNIGKPFIGQLYAKGEPLLDDNPRFASAALASEITRQHLLDSIFEAHCGMQARESLQPMLAIQLAKDASMASAMLDAAPAMLIAGGEHVRGDTGVPSHISTREPSAGIIVVQLMELSDRQEDPRLVIEGAGPADYYWFTPAGESKDYCAGVTGRAAQ